MTIGMSSGTMDTVIPTDANSAEIAEATGTELRILGSGKQCPGATRTQFACWGKIPNPQDQNFVLAAHLKNASLSAINKISFDADRICYV